MHGRHVRVAVPGGGPGREGLVQGAELGGGEPDLVGGSVLLEVPPALGPRYGDDVIALCEHPGESDLGRRDTFLCRDLPDLFDQEQVLLEVLRRKTRVSATEVVMREIVDGADRPGQETPAEG